MPKRSKSPSKVNKFWISGPIGNLVGHKDSLGRVHYSRMFRKDGELYFRHKGKVMKVDLKWKTK